MNGRCALALRWPCARAVDTTDPRFMEWQRTPHGVLATVLTINR